MNLSFLTPFRWLTSFCEQFYSHYQVCTAFLELFSFLCCLSYLITYNNAWIYPFKSKTLQLSDFINFFWLCWIQFVLASTRRVMIMLLPLSFYYHDSLRSNNIVGLILYSRTWWLILKTFLKSVTLASLNIY